MTTDTTDTDEMVAVPPAPRPAAAMIIRVGSLGDQVYSMEDEDGWQYHWNVTQGMQIARQRGDLLAFSPSEFGITPEHVRLRYPDIDEDHAMQTDTRAPLLFVPFKGKSQLVDGWHRLFKAVVTGIKELPAYCLTQAEADACLLMLLPPGRGVAINNGRDSSTIPAVRMIS